MEPSYKEDLKISDNSAGSTVGDDGSVSVKGLALDELLENRDDLFIKMDVEGSELPALLGARRIISECRPRLAICIYHFPGDVIDIPGQILEFCSDYRFKIRHYSSREWETVLYADINW